MESTLMFILYMHNHLLLAMSYVLLLAETRLSVERNISPIACIVRVTKKYKQLINIFFKLM